MRRYFVENYVELFAELNPLVVIFTIDELLDHIRKAVNTLPASPAVDEGLNLHFHAPKSGVGLQIAPKPISSELSLNISGTLPDQLLGSQLSLLLLLSFGAIIDG